MAEAKKIKRVVKHPKLYQIVDGKLQKVAPGTEVQVTEKKLEKSGKKFVDPSERQSVVKGKLVADTAGSEMAEKLAKAEAALAEQSGAAKELAEAKAKAEAALAEQSGAAKELAEAKAKAEERAAKAEQALAELAKSGSKK